MKAASDIAEAHGATPEQLAKLREKIVIQAMASDKRYDELLSRVKGQAP